MSVNVLKIKIKGDSLNILFVYMFLFCYRLRNKVVALVSQIWNKMIYRISYGELR